MQKANAKVQHDSSVVFFGREPDLWPGDTIKSRTGKLYRVTSTGDSKRPLDVKEVR